MGRLSSGSWPDFEVSERRRLLIGHDGWRAKKCLCTKKKKVSEILTHAVRVNLAFHHIADELTK